MTNIRQASTKHLTVGLTAVSFAIGYFGQQFLPIVAMTPAISTAQMHTLNGLFGIAQIVGLVLFGFMTDWKRPLLPIKLAAFLFLCAAVFGAVPNSEGLAIDRLLIGFAAGVIGSLFRTASRLAPSPHASAKTNTKLIIWPMTIGTAAGALLPVVGMLLAGGHAGRAMLNIAIAVIILLLALRLSDDAQAKTTKTQKPTLSPLILLLCLLSFFSAGAYAVFFPTISKEVAPLLPVSPLAFWGITAATYLIAAGAVRSITGRRKGTIKDTTGLALAFAVSSLAYALPTLANKTGGGESTIIFLAQFLAIVAGACADSFWASLISRLANPQHAGAIFGLSLTIGASGRMFWPFLTGIAIDRGANWQAVLVAAVSILCLSALTIITTSHLFNTKQNDRA